MGFVFAVEVEITFNPLVLRIQVLGQFFSPSESGLY